MPKDCKMSTLEDKILDGPTANYCDAEDDDIRTGEDAGDDVDDSEEHAERGKLSSLFTRPNPDSHDNSRSARSCGFSTNTGPKGVIEDFRGHSSPSSAPPEKLGSDDIEAEFQRLMNDDSILREYANKRLAQKLSDDAPTFGKVYRLRTGSELLDAIDNEKASVLVVVHIYTKYSRPCAKIDSCLDQLAHEQRHIKYLTLDASVAGLSSNFKENGVPAILAYRGGSLVKSLVQLEEMLDKDFDVEQLTELLGENGLI